MNKYKSEQYPANAGKYVRFPASEMIPQKETEKKQVDENLKNLKTKMIATENKLPLWGLAKGVKQNHAETDMELIVVFTRRRLI